jgi:dipeptidyl aminopeptidase/acylaminoacyl peptidase
MTHRKPLLLAVIVCAIASLAPAQTKRPMTFEDMMAMKRLGETAVSPDGQWLAYSVATESIETNKSTSQWYLQKISSGEPVQLPLLQPGDSGLQFSANGKQILFLSGRSGSPQIWLANFDTATGTISAYPTADYRDPFQLTHNSIEPDNARWSPDGKFIIFIAAVYPDCPVFTESTAASAGSPSDKCNADRDKAATDSKVKAQIFTELLYRHWNHFTGPKRSHLFLVHTEHPSPTELLVRDLTPNDPHDVPPCSLGGDGGFSISPDSKELAFTENPDEVPATSTSAQIYTLNLSNQDLTNPSPKPIKISTSAGGNFNPAYSPDGKYLAWRSQARAGYESDKFRLLLYDRTTKTAKNLLPRFDLWVDEFAWSPDSKSVVYVAGEKGEALINKVDLAGKLLGISGDGEFSGVRPMPNSKQVLAARMAVDQPIEVGLHESTPDHMPHCKAGADCLPSLSTWKPITHLNDTLLAQLDLPKLESFWFPSKDNTKVQGFLIRPPNFDPTKKYPVKFLIHGGPQGAWGDSWSYRWNAELFAANGYVVVMINPRGSTGYGQAFIDGINGDWGGKPYQDLMTGLDYAEQHYPFIDKSRECALGASYGGYMANWILGHTNRFKCIVSHDGMFNPESAFGTTEELWFNTWEFKGAPWDYYGKPDSDNPFRKWSPSLSVKNFKTPTLVIHSQLDYRLDVSEGYQLFTALQLQHVPSKFLYFPDEGHFVQKPQNSRLWYKTVNDWVDQWTTQK